MQVNVIQSFKAARSFGWAWMLGLLLLVLLPLPLVFTPEVLNSEEAAAAWINLAIMGPLALFFLLTLVSLPQMRYDLTPTELVLTCGPILRYRVPYAEITDVRTATLTPSLWSSMRLPGLALWKVPYADAGVIAMCATRMAKDILVLTTPKLRYGITPADEQAFLAALMPMLPKAAPAEQPTMAEAL
jgi:hypothetical protein